jgi:hypothetical protein
MNIVNSANEKVYWYCYNSLDGLKVIALSHDEIAASGGSASYTPPDNVNGFYGVRFIKDDSWLELAMGCVSKNGTIELVEGTGGAGTYTTHVR